MNRRKNHRALSVFLALALVSSLVAGTGFAASASETEDSHSEEVTAVETPDYEAEADSTEVLPGEDGKAVLTGEEAEAMETVEAEEANAAETVETEEPEAYLVSEETATSIQARIDALPTVEEYAQMDSDAQNKIYAEAEELYGLFDALTEEEQAQVDTEKLYDLLDYFTGQIETIDDVVAKIGETEYSDLASAVAAASGGDTITIVADITLSSTVTISDKSIIITSQESHSIKGSSSMKTIFSVPSGASLTLEGNVVIDGTGLAKNTSGKVNGATDGYGVIDVAGTLTINDNVAVENCTIGWASGVINVHGEGATFNLYGGSICDNTADFTDSSNTNTFGGMVRLYTGATMNMTGGAIEDNQVNGYTEKDNDGNLTTWSLNGLHQSAGIFVNGENVTVNISGGKITGNTASRGSAIYVYGMISAPVVNISGDAMISDNSYGEYAYYEENNGTIVESAGAVYVEYQGTVNMSGGTISNNKGFSGGGVTLLSYWLGSDEYVSAEFNMTGGTISGNSAYYGGGIYSYSTGVTITGGSIINNTAEQLGGGIYSEGNATSYGTVYLKNAIIKENTAYLEGGGLWLCPTGESTIYVTDGCAIYNNSATYDATKDYYAGTDTALNGSAAGDDVASGSQSPHSLTLAPRILGGGSVYYYEDGGLDSATNEWPEAWKTTDNPYWDSDTSTSTWPYPVVNSEERYGSSSDTEAKSVVNSSDYWALKSQAEATELAESLATVVISGNTARYGGGIGANGGVTIGTDSELTSVTVTKNWAEPNEEHPESVKVWLTNTVDGVTYKLQSVELNSENNWTYTFTDLPKNGSYSYSVDEESLSGYTYTVTGSVEDGFTITNTKIKTGDLTVSKTLSGNAADSSKEFTFTVTLSDTSISGTYGDMEFADGVATFTLKGGESKTATGLPAGVTYTVEESDNDGYTVTKTVDGTAVDEATGTIVSGGTSEVVFNNHKDSGGGGGGGSTYTSVTVKKVWTLDDGGTAADSVTVNLLRNGTVYATVTLDENNNWTYTWSGLDDSYTWTVEEADVPDGFTSSTTHSGTTWTITNDDVPEDTDVPDEPDTPDTPSNPDNPDTPSMPDSPSSPDTPSTPDKPLDDVPQTGDNTNLSLWLTLMFLALAGMVVTVIVGRRTRYCGAHEAKHRKR